MNEKDCIRLEEFRQLKEEIRGSEEYLIVGIDMAKERHNAFFGTAAGKALFRRLVFQNDREGFERLLIQAEAIQVQQGLKKVVFGLEPTANYHKPLGEYLIKAGHYVVLVSTKSVKRNRELLDGRWDKHDMKDSPNVADLICQGKCGKADLRYALYQAAMIASSRDRDFITWFTNKLRGRAREKGIKVKMRVKLSAKLLIIAWTLMKKKEPFNPKYLNIE